MAGGVFGGMRTSLPGGQVTFPEGTTEGAPRRASGLREGGSRVSPGFLLRGQCGALSGLGRVEGSGAHAGTLSSWLGS